MKLLKFGASPFVRKVVVTLHETGQFDDVEIVHGANSLMEPEAELTAMNPIGKIPALIRDDGITLYDSRVITRFLNDRAGASLYPEARIWDVLTLEATGEGILEAALSIVYEKRYRAPEIHSQEWMDAQWLKVERCLDALEERWMSHLAGPIDAGQIAVGCALGYLDLRHDDRNWREGRPQLAAWEEKFSQRPSMQATVPQG